MYNDEKEKLAHRHSELTIVRGELKSVQEDLRSLNERNGTLEQRLKETHVQLQLQQERPWWSLAAELATSPLGALHSAARIAMPTLPPADKLLDRTESESHCVTEDEGLLEVSLNNPWSQPK